MPSTYAHYRLGCQALSVMDPETASIVRRNRRFFDMGVHGPDLFFYYGPSFSKKISSLGSFFHAQSGAAFFTRVCRELRLNPSEAKESYLYGVLCHYALDSMCHPFVHEQGEATHVALETEFDRFLLELDGKIPQEQDLSIHMRFDKRDCAVIAPFYPPAKEEEIARCVWNMRTVTHLLTVPGNAIRSIVKTGIGLAGAADLMMPPEPNAALLPLDAPMKALYDQALTQYPAMLATLRGHLHHGAGFDELYKPTFG
jgi:hypothetical protein